MPAKGGSVELETLDVVENLHVDLASQSSAEKLCVESPYERHKGVTT